MMHGGKADDWKKKEVYTLYVVYMIYVLSVRTVRCQTM